MTSATDELRRLLDERGVEYYGGYDITEWDVDGTHYLATEPLRLDGRIVLRRTCTPEQAIDATLGRGTCHDDGDPGDFCCSECGVRMFTNTSDTYTMIAADEHTIIKHPNFCPNCGKQVVE